MKKKSFIKRLYIISFISMSILSATTVESRLGISVGVLSTKNSDGSKFNNPTFDISYQNNTFVVMPRVDLEYVKLKEDSADALLKVSFNGVYEYDENPNFSPYILGGVGYESVQKGQDGVFESHPFIQVGGGVSVPLINDYTFNVESKFLQILGGNNENNEISIHAGFTYPLEYSNVKRVVKVKEVIREKRVPVYIKVPSKPIIVRVPKPIPIPIVQPTPRPTPKPTPQRDKNSCSIKINLPDLDRDGVEDRLDQCPGTPCNFTVDSYGCPIKATLKINFGINSDVIERESYYKVSRFADFLLKNRGSSVKIVGHTDSVGTQSNNLSLSKRRANSVMRALIEKGVSPARLTAEGMGESMPIASNETNEGKAMNRRIEAELSYLKGRN